MEFSWDYLIDATDKAVKNHQERDRVLAVIGMCIDLGFSSDHLSITRLHTISSRAYKMMQLGLIDRFTQLVVLAKMSTSVKEIRSSFTFESYKEIEIDDNASIYLYGRPAQES